MKKSVSALVITLGIFFGLVTGILPCSNSLAADDLAIYTDSLASGWANWSWGTTVNLSSSTPVHGGTYSIAATYTAAWGGLYLHTDSAINLSGYERLTFFVNGGSTGNQSISVVANGSSSAFAVTAPVNSWGQIDIPLTKLGSPSSLSDLYWQDVTGGTQPTFYLDDIKLIASSGPPPPPGTGPALSINVTSGRHAINENIYGMNYADETLATQLRLPVRRWGGNSTSRYNWQTNIHNTGSDWYFENIPDGPNVTDGSASDLFVEQDRRTGTKTLITVPLIGWTPKSNSPRAHPYACGFKVSKYGAQQSTDADWDPDCGDGVQTDGSTYVTGNDPTDTSTQITTSFVTAWINHLKGRYGTAANGGVAYYDLDNEPMLWNSTHHDVHPQATTYDEIRDSTWQYAAAVKNADPSAKTLGPVLWGWCAYFFSAKDGCGIGTDYTSHGNTAFVPWYLQQMKTYEQSNGVRILDYLDLHCYPQSGVSLRTAGDAATQAKRLRSTKSLWDTTYVDESWIGTSGWEGGIVKLIPRMKEWVNNNYSNTKLAITEYNWGGLEHINGALAQADVLGIFGREGLDLATLWGLPSLTQPGAFAFRMYRNYDGSGHGFGDVSVEASSANQDTMSVYAAQRSADNGLTIMVINKTGNTLTSSISLTGIAPAPTAKRYQYSTNDLTAIVALADQAVTPTGFSADFPANSITLFIVIPTASVPLPPGNLRLLE